LAEEELNEAEQMEEDFITNYQDDDEEYQVDEQYMTEEFRHKFYLARTAFKEDVRKHTQNSLISEKAKNALYLLVDTHFSPTAVLANLSDLRLAVIDLEIAIVEWRLSCNRTDILQPEFPLLTTLLVNHYELYTSRAIGKERERMLEAKSITEKHLGVTPQSRLKGEKPKRGFFNRMFGG